MMAIVFITFRGIKGTPLNPALPPDLLGFTQPGRMGRGRWVERDGEREP